MSQLILPNERATLIVDAHGPLPMSVSYATGGGPEDSAYVLVRSPDTLVYALDARAAAAVTYSLLLARARAGHALPAEYRPREQAFDRSVVGSVTLRGDRRIGEPRALDADHSPNGTAHVLLRLDGLTVRIYDQAALDMYAKAWVEAHEAAQNAFGVGHVPTIQTLLHRASQQSRTPYRLESLSLDHRPTLGASRPERSSELRSL